MLLAAESMLPAYRPESSSEAEVINPAPVLRGVDGKIGEGPVPAPAVAVVAAVVVAEQTVEVKEESARDSPGRPSLVLVAPVKIIAVSREMTRSLSIIVSSM